MDDDVGDLVDARAARSDEEDDHAGAVLCDSVAHFLRRVDGPAVEHDDAGRGLGGVTEHAALHVVLRLDGVDAAQELHLEVVIAPVVRRVRPHELVAVLIRLAARRVDLVSAARIDDLDEGDGAIRAVHNRHSDLALVIAAELGRAIRALLDPDVVARRPQEAAGLVGAEDGVARDALLAHEDGQLIEVDGVQLLLALTRLL